MGRLSKNSIILLVIFLVFITITLFVFQPLQPSKSGNPFLEKKQEIKIHSLNPLELIDYHPQSGLFLGFSLTSDGLEITLVNENGEIVNSKNLRGEGPDQYVSSLNALSFSTNGDVWAITNMEVVLYDQSLNMKEKRRFTPHSSIVLNNWADLLCYFYPDNTPNSPSFIINPIHVPMSTAMDFGFYDSKMIEIHPWGSDTTYQMAAVSDRVISEAIDLSLSTMFAPVYVVDKLSSRLYLIGTLDHEITVYDLNKGTVVDRIEVAHEQFVNLKSGKIGRHDLPFFRNRIPLNSKNHRLLRLESGVLILDYNVTVPESKIEKELIENPRYILSEDPTIHRLIVFDKGTQVSSDIKLPKNGKLSTAMSGNKMLFLIEPETEEDFIRYDVYELKFE